MDRVVTCDWSCTGARIGAGPLIGIEEVAQEGYGYTAHQRGASGL